MKKYLLSAFVLFLILSPAFAQENSAPQSLARVQAPQAEKIPVLKKIGEMAGKKSDVEYDYLGKEFDADVWLISGDTLMEMVHVLPSGAAIMGGTFVSPEGKELGSVLQKKFAAENPERAQQILTRVRASIEKNNTQTGQSPAPQAETSQEFPKDAAATAEMIWSHMDKLGLVRYGAEKDAPVVYLVLDPTQPDSIDAFKKLEPFAEAKKIDLRAVPISFSSEQVLMNVALILPHKEAPRLLKALMNGRSFASKEPPNPDGGLLLKNTADFVEAMRLNVLPSLFYRHSPAEPIRAVKGPPKDWTPILKDLSIE